MTVYLVTSLLRIRVNLVYVEVKLLSFGDSIEAGANCKKGTNFKYTTERDYF